MEDTEHRLTQVEERAKSNSRRLDQVEKRQSEIGDLVTSMATMAQKQETMERDVGEIKLKVDTIAAQPGKRQCITHKVQPRTDLYEIRATKMTCLYDELFFHDNEADCRWFHTGGMEQLAEETVQALCEICKVVYKPQEQPTEPVKPAEPAAPETPAPETPAAPEKPAAPKAGDKITLSGGRLYTTARGAKYVTRTGTYFLYDGQKVGARYRVTNRTDRVGKKPAAVNVSGWVEL